MLRPGQLRGDSHMDLATVDYLLTTTHSVRKRLDLTRSVEPAVIERCIEIALHAPSGGNRQGWHFVVVTDPQKRLGIAGLYRKSWYAYDQQRASNNPRLQAGDSQYTAQTMRVR